jgi:type VI secretion system protein ImpK
MKELLATADAEAKRAGYAATDVSSVLYAFVAFLDESVLNSNQPMFAEWHRRPLQEEVFGGHIGGELFFQQLRELLARQDSPELAECLEVFQLCLLLGFSGRFRGQESSELHNLVRTLTERIDRIRGPLGTLSPAGISSPNEAIPRQRDRWVSRLTTTTVIFGGLIAVLFAVFSWWLSGQVASATGAAGSLP